MLAADLTNAGTTLSTGPRNFDMADAGWDVIIKHPMHHFNRLDMRFDL